jgi:hypothetical protein
MAELLWLWAANACPPESAIAAAPAANRMIFMEFSLTT